MVLKQQLKLLLRKNDLNASQLARKSGLPRQTINDWLGGSPPRDVRQVKKVADALAVSVDHLCFGSAEESESKQTDISSLLGDEWIGGVFEMKIRRVKPQK